MSPQNGTVLQITGLGFRYAQQSLFSDWSCSIPPGVTWIQGGEGTGKSTLLRLMAGEVKAQAGDLYLKNVSLDQQLLAYRAQVFCTDPRSLAFDALTPLQFFDATQHRFASWNEASARDLAEGLSLVPHLEKPLFMLSTGTKRKVWLTAAFAANTCLTLLDEPFAALDKTSIEFVVTLLQGAAQHTTRAWVVADYTIPAGIALSNLIDLGD